MPAATRHQEPVPAFAEAFHAAERRLPGGIAELRSERFARFQATGIPTQRIEAWRFTNVGKHANQAMASAPRSSIGAADVAAYFAGGHLARRLIFVNGHLVPEMSHARGLPPGVVVGNLADLLGVAWVRERLAGLDDGRSFTDLNTALVESGAVIDVPEGVRVEAPIQLVFVTAGQGTAIMTHPRVLVRLGAGARLHLLETHAAVRDGACLTNLVEQIDIGAGAELVHDRIQLGRDGTTLIGKSDIELASKAQLKQTLVTLGGTLLRNESEVRLAGTNIDALLNGAFMPTAAEHVDNLIRIHHLQPDCHSNQFYKGVMDGHGRGVFAGKIIVHKDAQRTNAFQTNNNLLLSDDAEIDSKPELEIYADDVKCSHGATCGDHDETALFYLRSRGFDRATAESVLTYAFAGEIIERLADPAMRKLAMARIFERLPGGEALKGML